MIFRFIEKLEKNIRLISIFLFVFLILFLYLTPVLFGLVLIITVVPLFIGFFSFKDVFGSLKKMIITLFIIGVISSPIIIGNAMEKHKMNNPELIINRDHPEIIRMTEDFKNYSNNSNNLSHVADEIKGYVHSQIPYHISSFYYPTTDSVMSLMSSDCRGRALVGYAILKNLGYNVYITGGFAGGTHAWLRIYEKNASSSEVRSSILNDTSDGTGIKFYESMTVPYVKKVWLILNEDNTYWDSSLSQLYTIFRYGFKMEDFSMIFLANLFFLYPIFLIGICLLAIKRIKNLWSYFLMLFGVVIIVLISGHFGIATLTVLPLPIMIGSGLYIRWLNYNFR
ncbi:MAG: hypothetical protein KAU07_02115 [Candidatus Andersenbacteria bacterium]|nr:hypothetical protein [Candidatus Andersenbacteria bacterium]